MYFSRAGKRSFVYDQSCQTNGGIAAKLHANMQQYLQEWQATDHLYDCQLPLLQAAFRQNAKKGTCTTQSRCCVDCLLLCKPGYLTFFAVLSKMLALLGQSARVNTCSSAKYRRCCGLDETDPISVWKSNARSVLQGTCNAKQRRGSQGD